MADLLAAARFEVLPTAAVTDLVAGALPTGSTVTVTASPARGLGPTLEVTERLAAAGYVAVPHLAARMVADRQQLRDVVDRLRACGVDQVFVPGGDAPEHGAYPDALSLLEDLTALGRPFAQVGVAGYPEAHPRIHDDLLVQAMWDKRHHASHIVSNLTFHPAEVARWMTRVRARGVDLPVLLGLPGPVDPARLLSIATKVGVGESRRFLAKNTGLFARLLAPGGFTGERFLRDCVRVLGDAGVPVSGLHVFTFNQVSQAAAWRDRLLDELAGTP